jgi:hypothetical protein
MLPAGSLEYTPEFRFTLPSPHAVRTIPANRPRLPMPFGYRRDRDKALELSFRLPLFGGYALVQRLYAAQRWSHGFVSGSP